MGPGRRFGRGRAAPPGGRDVDTPSYGLRCGRVFIAGVRTSWHTEAGGEFYCAACGGEKTANFMSQPLVADGCW